MKYTTAFLISIIFALCIAMEINYETHKELQKVHIELDKSIYKAGYLDGVKAYQDSLKFDKTRFSNDSTEFFKYLK